MKDYLVHDEWCVIEDKFHSEHNEITESLMSLGNGRMGQRGNFEENYSGKSLQGNYVAGVWFPDKTRVGWWKNGYPDYFAKVINACDWTSVEINVEGEEFDLAKVKILNFKRVLNMKEGTLSRECEVEFPSGNIVKVTSLRFCSMAHDESGALKMTITPVNFSGEICIKPALDGDVKNKDANHGEVFWNELAKESTFGEAYLTMETKKSPWENVPTFQVCTGMKYEVIKNGLPEEVTALPLKGEKFIGAEIKSHVILGETLTLIKYAVNISSENYATSLLTKEAKNYIKNISEIGFEEMLTLHKEVWAEKWNRNDIKIEGDKAAQQGIRFNIFHLQQTYTGKDARLNIGPKGFTGEKYGGVTYWDTEAYCLPFYLSVSEPEVSRNLLVYRHNHLQKAIENAQKLGFSRGAALYPMVTMNGEECHNEWEITFEEIHRNGAIAYAIFDYINYTGDKNYLNEFGLDVLISISRFWAQRVNWSANLNKYVMLGVTGPNEYENNVNNNFYTNYLAVWTLKYTLESIQYCKENAGRFAEISSKLSFDFDEETKLWNDIIEKMHFPYDSERGVYLQQDGFLDKELLSVDQITEHRPINQKWSWDRILRSCFIKQADVLQGFYFFENDFDLGAHRRNFDFYEPMTVHESSLSPCVHTILACKLDKIEKAYEMYVRTARLDLDDYNNDTEDGLHITSMAGTWMSVVKGFGGMRVDNTQLQLNPKLPANWEGLAFRIGINGVLLEVKVNKSGVSLENLSDKDVEVKLYDSLVNVKANSIYQNF